MSDPEPEQTRSVPPSKKKSRPRPTQRPPTRRTKVTMQDGGTLSIEALDKDGDGVIDKSEFLAAGGTETDFALLDADGDGVIDEAEIQSNDALSDEIEVVVSYCLNLMQMGN